MPHRAAGCLFDSIDAPGEAQPSGIWKESRRELPQASELQHSVAGRNYGDQLRSRHWTVGKAPAYCLFLFAAGHPNVPIRVPTAISAQARQRRYSSQFAFQRSRYIFGFPLATRYAADVGRIYLQFARHPTVNAPEQRRQAWRHHVGGPLCTIHDILHSYSAVVQNCDCRKCYILDVKYANYVSCLISIQSQVVSRYRLGCADDLLCKNIEEMRCEPGGQLFYGN